MRPSNHISTATLPRSERSGKIDLCLGKGPKSFRKFKVQSLGRPSLIQQSVLISLWLPKLRSFQFLFAIFQVLLSLLALSISVCFQSVIGVLLLSF